MREGGRGVKGRFDFFQNKHQFWRRQGSLSTTFNNCLQVILVGNKCDMEDERVSWKKTNYDDRHMTIKMTTITITIKKQVISYERGKQLADSLGLDFFETSAKENINVRVGCHFDLQHCHRNDFNSYYICQKENHHHHYQVKNIFGPSSRTATKVS